MGAQRSPEAITATGRHRLSPRWTAVAAVAVDEGDGFLWPSPTPRLTTGVRPLALWNNPLEPPPWGEAVGIEYRAGEAHSLVPVGICLRSTEGMFGATRAGIIRAVVDVMSWSLEAGK